jgi:hypothetical protein
MKTLLLLICCFALLVGCTAETQPAEDVELPSEPEVPAVEAVEAEDAVFEDQVLVDNENITVESIDDVVEVDVKGAMDENAASAFTFDACVEGSTYSFEQDGATSNTVLKGVVSYKGADWCQGYSETTIHGITAKTTYYIVEGAQEYWVVSEVMGQTNEMYIVN